MNTTTEQTASESEPATEYKEVIPSQHSSGKTSLRRHTLRPGDTPKSHTKSTNSVSAQTDGVETAVVESQLNWTLQHVASLNDADRHLTWLQTRVRQSLLADQSSFFKNSTKSIGQLPPREHNNSSFMLSSPRRAITNNQSSLSTATDKRKQPMKPSQLLNSPKVIPTREVRDLPELDIALSSPLKKQGSPDRFFPVCPQVGISPSESKRGVSPISDKATRTPKIDTLGDAEGSFDRDVNNQSVERPPVSECRSNLLSEHGQLFHSQSNSRCGFSTGLLHLAEERSRIQRKLSRLRVSFFMNVFLNGLPWSFLPNVLPISPVIHLIYFWSFTLIKNETKKNITLRKAAEVNKGSRAEKFTRDERTRTGDLQLEMPCRLLDADSHLAQVIALLCLWLSKCLFTVGDGYLKLLTLSASGNAPK